MIVVVAPNCIKEGLVARVGDIIGLLLNPEEHIRYVVLIAVAVAFVLVAPPLTKEERVVKVRFMLLVALRKEKSEAQAPVALLVTRPAPRISNLIVFFRASRNMVVDNSKRRRRVSSKERERERNLLLDC